jgi:tetratricopeptide (TPR) repeat protein
MHLYNAKILAISLFICVSCANAHAAEKLPLYKQNKLLRSNFRYLVHRGNKLLEEAALSEALDVYEQARSLQDKQEPRLIYRIAYLHYTLGNNQLALELLNSIEQEKKVPEVHYLRGRIWASQGHLEQATSQYNIYLSRPGAEYEKAALYELSLILKETGQYSKAKQHLFRLKDESYEPEWQQTAIASLVELMLLENRFDEAAKLSSALANHSECTASHFCQGIVAFYSQDFKSAISSLELASQTHEKKFKPLRVNALQYIIHAQCFLALDGEDSFEQQRQRLHAMEEKLQVLFAESSFNDSGYPYIHFLSAKGKLLGDLYSLEGARKTLFQSSKRDIRHLYFAAILLEGSELQEHLQTGNFSKAPLAYLTQALQFQGLENLSEGSKNFSKANVDVAFASFQQALEKAQTLPATHQAGLIKGLSTTALLSSSPILLKETYQTERKFLAEKSLELPAVQVGELYYLHGLICQRLGQRKPNLPYTLEAKQSWIDAALKAKGSKVADEALFALGSLTFANNQYEEAKKAFLTLQDSDRKGAESLYYAAQSAEQLGEDPKSIKRLLIRNYPQTDWAAESFLTYYPYATYISGDAHAISHLREMPVRMPKSRWLVPAYFLIGVSLREGKSSQKVDRMQSALQAFQNAEKVYHASTISDEETSYFATYRFYAGLEKAKTAISLSHVSPEAKKQFFLTYARGALEEITLELEEGQTAAAKAINEYEPYSKIHEQADFELAKVLHQQQKNTEALNTLDKMISRYQSLQVTRSEYLARALFEKAKIQFEARNLDASLTTLELAEQSSLGAAAPNLRLKAWLLASECLTFQNEYHEAMKLLSRVINEDIASSLRLKAMYKRAELYNLQGKPELAQRQLEALAKFKGPWPEKAKQELEHAD